MAYETRDPMREPNVRLLLTVVVAVIVAAACVQNGQKTNGRVDTGVAAVATDTAAIDTMAMIGDTAQFFYPEKNLDSTKALVAAGHWDDTDGRKWIGPLDCGDGLTCGGATHKTVQFRIRPRINGHRFNHKRILHGQDPEQFLAELTNLETVPYGPWHIEANETVYLYIGLRRIGNRRVTIYRIDPIDGTRTPLVTAQAAAVCDVTDDHKYPRVQVYKPWHCYGKPDMRPLYGSPYEASGTSDASIKPSIVRLASNSLVSAAAQAINSGLWISCSGGCCEGSNFQ